MSETDAAQAEDTSVSTESVTETTQTEPTVETPEAITETPEVEAEVKAETEVEQPSGDDSAEPEKKPKKNSFQERISQKTRQAKEAETKAREFEERAQIAEQRLKEIQGSEDVKFPQLTDFDYDEAQYQEAVVNYNAQLNERSVHKAMTAQENLKVEALKRDANTAAVEAFQARSSQFAEETSDYVEVVSSPAFVQGQAMQQAIVLSENGPALAYHLASNPGKAAEINSMAPGLAMMELGILSQRLSTPPSVITSNTPAPMKPVTTSGTVEKSLDDMSTDEYRRARGYIK